MRQTNNPVYERKDNVLFPFANDVALEARVHSQATKSEVAPYENVWATRMHRQIELDHVVAWQLFIRKFITDTVNGKNIFRLAGFDFNLPANILNVGIDGAFV